MRYVLLLSALIIGFQNKSSADPLRLAKDSRIELTPIYLPTLAITETNMGPYPIVFKLTNDSDSQKSFSDYRIIAALRVNIATLSATIVPTSFNTQMIDKGLGKPVKAKIIGKTSSDVLGFNSLKVISVHVEGRPLQECLAHSLSQKNLRTSPTSL